MQEQHSTQPDFAGAHKLLMEHEPSKELLIQFMEAHIRKFKGSGNMRQAVYVEQHEQLLEANNDDLANYCYSRAATLTSGSDVIATENLTDDSEVVSGWADAAAAKWRRIGNYLADSNSKQE